MKIAIIGAGFSGLAVAWYLSETKFKSKNLKISVFDQKGIGGGASGIAAGFLHPFAGAHAKLNWCGKEGMEATQELLDLASLELNRPVYATNQGIIRLAITSEQKEDFKLCSNLYSNDTKWIEEDECKEFNPNGLQTEALWIKKGKVVYCDSYLDGLWKGCEKRGVELVIKRIENLKELDDFDLTILANGLGVFSLPETRESPLSKVKGQMLELSWPESIAPLKYAINSHVYIAMKPSNRSCMIGTTFERGYKDFLPDIETAKKEILPKVYEILPFLRESKVLNCTAGARVVGPLHRPYIKQLGPKQWLLTGMGSKGLLYHALYAKELVQSVIYGEPLV